MEETKGYLRVSTPAFKDSVNGGAYNLELDRDHAEVENLDRRPKDKVGLQCREIYVAELVHQSPSAAALGESHECEKAEQTWCC